MEVTPKRAAKWFADKAQSLAKSIAKAEEQNLKDNIRAAQKLSTGKYSTLALTLMGHPYATRKPNPPADAAIINRQTGLFYNSWNYLTPVWMKGELYGIVVNTAPYAGFMRGTVLMIARPIYDRMAEMTEQSRFIRHEKLLTRTLTPK